MKIIKFFLKLFLFFSFLAASCLLGALFFVMHNQCIDFAVLENYSAGKPSILLDDEGNEWARFQLDKHEPIKLNQMPMHLIQAFMAAEDWNFFNHVGISWRGILRSSLINLYHGRKVQGASTITQQLVKLLFFDSKKTFERKIKEQLYAILIERQCTKDQILETYLNHVCFGCGIYGVQAACQRFWGISVKDISVAQAAMLAGIIRSPSNYCPLLYPQSAQKRRNIILQSMRKLNYISQEMYEQSRTESAMLKQLDTSSIAPHLKEAIRIMLEDQLGKKVLYCDGLVIQTTLNKKMQQEAIKVFYEQCAHLKKTLLREIDGGLISMETKSGEIKALIGGYDFNTSKFNRALQARRQIGSIIKPLVFAAALGKGLTFADTQIDEPFEMSQKNGQVWRPNNYNDEFNGQVTLAYALSHSNNIVTIKTLLKTGVQPVIDLARKCHIQGPFFPYPSLALGCIDATLKEVVGMFNIFANSGIYIEPHFIKWIKDQWGTKIYKRPIQQEYVLSSRICSQVAKVLTHALERTRAAMKDNWITSEAISKTGTTNDSRVCWYLGSTPQYTTGVYIGCDDNRPMGKNIFPIRTAFPIWLGLNKAIGSEPKKFAYDSSLKEVLIDEISGQQVYAKDKGVLSILA